MTFKNAMRSVRRRFQREHHPEQSRRCWWLSFLFGSRLRGGSFVMDCGTNHWGVCDRCDWSVDSL